MRLEHLAQFQPICPNCLTRHADAQSLLQLTQSSRTRDDHIIEGILQCPEADCLSEFPIIDGIPIILTQLRAYVSDNLFAITSRLDLSSEIESLIGDCCSQSSPFDNVRTHASCYAWDHYGEFDPSTTRQPDDIQPGSIVRLLGHFVTDPLSERNTTNQSLEVDEHSVSTSPIAPLLSGPCLDLGCSVGRNSFELAARSRQPVLGIDMNFAMLRLAGQVLRHGELTYPLRRSGVAYDRRSFPVPLPDRQLVDFWVCDATCLPLAAGTVANGVAFNLLDAVAYPGQLIQSLMRVLRGGGQAILACPYDWSLAATPIEAWLGGHSQRGTGAGDPVAQLLAVLAPFVQSQEIQIVNQCDDLPWTIRLHDRSAMQYRLHGIRWVRS